MAVVIRLKRMGTKKKPHNRIVVIDKKMSRDGRFVEEVGFYDPSYNPPVAKINKERVQYWLSKGAKPSDVVKNILRKTSV